MLKKLRITAILLFISGQSPLLSYAEEKLGDLDTLNKHSIELCKLNASTYNFDINKCEEHVDKNSKRCLIEAKNITPENHGLNIRARYFMCVTPEPKYIFK